MYELRVWNQANDGQTMAILVANVTELASFATCRTQPNAAGNWASLQDYLDAAAVSAYPPPPYVKYLERVMHFPVEWVHEC